MPLSPGDFVHLHVHSEYSLLDGANRIAPLVEHVKGLGQPAVALTDHGVLFGALEFYKAARKAGVKPILGCELYITPNSRHLRHASELKQTHHLLLLAEDYEGYQNICKLSSLGHTEGFYAKPRIDFETLAQHTKGVIATSSCLSGLIPTAMLAENETKVREYAGRFIDLFGPERFFIELMDHGLRDQKRTNPALIELARRDGLKFFASNDAHYLRRQDAELHDVLLCVQTGKTLNDPTRMKFDASEFYVKSTAEMEALFPGLEDALTNTRLIAEMCNVEMPERQYRLPRFPCPDGMSEEDYLRAKVQEGARALYGARADDDAELRERISFEVETICRMGFPAYFLIVADFIEYARSVDIPVGPGRGSAAGSVVAYCLGITELDPLEHGLLFERFLNPDRLSMPDIDIDFCFERRNEVIEYVRRKYGEECVCQIITFGTLKPRLAVRDMGRVMEVPLDVVDRLAKSIPLDPKMTIDKAMNQAPQLRDMAESDPQIAKLLEMARQTEGMARNAGTHAAGVIIADRPLTEYCPLFQSSSMERPATQFTMTQVEEDLGLLKMDFLGIKNLTIIKRVTDWLAAREGIEIDWKNVPMDDPRTYEELQAGRTLGVFQLESEGMTRLVQRLRPTEFNDLTALLALYRPGPLGANMHDMYVRRKHGEEKVRYDHEILEPILNETYGVVLYQEQVMRIAMTMCGFTRGEADVLRKAMGKKQSDVMARMAEKWIEGAPKTSGVPKKLAEKIWVDILNFASYGFNKSHSAAYAVITYRTAYLRAHHPVYFLAALLTNEIGANSDGIAKYVAHCRDMGIEVLPVDINRSLEYFNPDPPNRCIYYAINGLKGLGTEFARGVVREREKNGPYKSLQDFALRLPREHINHRALEILVKAGAFDAIAPNRPGLLAALKDILELAHDVRRSREAGLADMFALSGSDGDDALVAEVPIPNLPPWDDKQRAETEKEILGFYLADHPLQKFEVELASFCDLTAAKVEERAHALGRDEKVSVTLMGYVTDIVDRVTKNGDPWSIVTLEDMTGTVEVKFFPRAREACAQHLRLESILQVKGSLSVWNDRPSLEGFNVTPADQLRNEARGISIEWRARDLAVQALFELTETAKRFPGTKGVMLRVCEEGEVVAEYAPPEVRIALTESCVQALANLPGKPTLRFLPPPASVDTARRRFGGSGRAGK